MLRKKSPKTSKEKNKKTENTSTGAEKLASRLTLVLDASEALAKRIERLNEDFDSLRKESSFKFDALGEFLKELRGETRDNFKSVLEYLTRIDDEIQDLKSNLAEIKSGLKKKADTEHLLKLEVRLARIEKDLERYKSRFS